MPLLITPRYLEKRADFYDQLSRMIAAGLPLEQLFDTLRTNPDRESRAVVAMLQKQIAKGTTLTEALQNAHGWAPDFDIALLEAGESSGRLDQAFRSLSDHYTRKARLTKEMISQMMYPVFILHLALLIFPPKLITAAVWEGKINEFFIQKAIAFGTAYVLVFVILKTLQSRTSPALRGVFERVGSAIPGLASAQRAVAMSRLSACLEALISAGQPIPRAWEVAANATGSRIIQRASAPLVAGAIMGTPPGELLVRDRTFPDLFANLYRTGEISGDLDGALKRLAVYYTEEGVRKMQAIAQWVPRLLYLAILIGVGYFIVQFWMNYFGGVVDSLNQM